MFLAIVIPLVFTIWGPIEAAFRELGDHGYGSQAFHPARDELNVIVRVVIVVLYIAMVLAVAVRSGLNFISEIEKETWTSLIATPLDATEILSGKILGTFWGMRWMGLIYLAFVALGLAAGAVHPSAGVLVLLELAIFLAIRGGAGNRVFTLVEILGFTRWVGRC